jgi:hypothetical protein
MLENYILDHRDVVPEPDYSKWEQWMETADLILATTDNGVIRIKTLFLGIDQNFDGSGPPLLFETMTYLTDEFEEETERLKVEFRGLECWRWSTWEEADAGHWKVARKMFRRLDQFRGPLSDVIKYMRVDTPAS